MNKIFITILLLTTYLSNCQSHKNESDLNSLELGLSNFIVFDSHQNLFYATDIHVIKSINKKIGVGIGYATIFEHQTSHEIITFLNYKPTTNLLLNMGPNFILPSEENSFMIAAHIETEYLVKLYKEFKIGPTFEIDLGKINHYGFGLHLALDL